MLRSSAPSRLHFIIRRAACGVALVLALGLLACSPIVKDGQPVQLAPGISLKTGQSVGQTFTARDRGLDGIDVFLTPALAPASSETDIRLHLRASAETAADLATASLPAQAVTAPGFYRFSFPSRGDSQNRDYYMVLEYAGEGALEVGTADPQTYLDGAAYVNDVPVDAQMTFRLTYDPAALAVGIAGLVAGWLGILLLVAFLFLLPGWACLTFLWRPQASFDWATRLALASALSLAIYPILFYWTSLAGLRLGALYAWVPPLLAAAYLLWCNRAWRPHFRIGWKPAAGVLPDIALVIVLALIVFTRFWVVRSVDVPMWGDSYQHSMIAQLMLDNGGMFESWQPYADLLTFTYHFGFHTAVAVFDWLSGMPVQTATLWTGQILNALGVLAIYPLAVRVGKSRWAGVGAVAIAGLFSSMPMYYVNWGRYTQLAGQVILPGALFILWETLDRDARDRRLNVLSWIALGGLALTHYLVLVLAVVFVPIYWLLHIKRWRALLPATFLAGIGGLVIFLPWFFHIAMGKLALNVATRVDASPAILPTLSIPDMVLLDTAGFFPSWVALLFFACAVWALVSRRREGVLIAGWWMAVILAANPQWLRLPGADLLGNFTIQIATYLPVGILLGAALGWLTRAIPPRGALGIALCLVLSIAGVWGARQRLGDVQLVDHALVTRADLRAAAWIRANTPAEARFLVNTFLAYDGMVAVGSDGGWWLPLLAARQVSVPPINYAIERGPTPEYAYWVNALPEAIQKKGIAAPDVVAMLHERGITYVYIGQQRGRVNYNGPDILVPQKLLDSPAFRPVYHQDLVWVFAVQ